MTSPNAPDGNGRPTSGLIGLIIANLTKFAGLVIVINEALLEPVLRPAVIGVAALMMAGAQGLESFLRSFFGK